MLFMGDSRLLVRGQQMRRGKNWLPFRRSFKFLNLSGKNVRCSFKFNGGRQKQLPFSLFFKLDSFCFRILF